jgi:hypothetical protein
MVIFQFNRVGFCEDIHTKQRRADYILFKIGEKDIVYNRKIRKYSKKEFLLDILQLNALIPK